MATSVTLNGLSYSVPAVGEGSWGTSLSNYLIALSTGVLSKAGGAFTLTGEVDFGSGFGLKSISYKSRGTVSTVGVFRLGNAEYIGWRNAANSADKLLRVNSSDQLEFDGTPITPFASLTASRAMVTNGSGVPAASSVTSTEIGYLSGVTSAIQTQIDTNSSAIATKVTSGGALGTPSSGTATNLTGLPISTGVSGLGSGVATFLGTPSPDNLRSALTSAFNPAVTVNNSGVSITAAASGTGKQLCGAGISLTAGKTYLISAVAELMAVSGTAQNFSANSHIDISTTANSGTGVNEGDDVVSAACPFTNAEIFTGQVLVSMKIVNYVITPGSTATYYLNGTAAYGSTAPVWYAKMTAVQIG